MVRLPTPYRWGRAALTAASLERGPVRCRSVGEIQLAIVEDDPWKRSALVDHLDRHPGVAVVHALDQDAAAVQPKERWAGVHAAIVDVFDDKAPGEIGTDLYSGISAVERLASVPVKVLAIMPHTPHPLVQLRLCHAHPDWVYLRWELPTVTAVVAALESRPTDRQPTMPDSGTLFEHGAERARPNEAVRAYLRSPLAGLLHEDLGQKRIEGGRATTDRLRRQVIATGFTGTELRGLSDRRILGPRWPDVRSYLLRLLGRLDAPPSEFEKPWLP